MFLYLYTVVQYVSMNIHAQRWTAGETKEMHVVVHRRSLYNSINSHQMICQLDILFLKTQHHVTFEQHVAFLQQIFLCVHLLRNTYRTGRSGLMVAR